MEKITSTSIKNSQSGMGKNVSSFIEKRASVRYPLAMFVEFENGSGWTCDVSTTGVCIETDQPLASGAAVRFLLNQQASDGALTRILCQGVVVRAEQVGEIWRVAFAMEAVRFEG